MHLIVVDAQVGENLGEELLLRARQHAQVDRHDLQILGTRRARDVAWPYPDVEDVRRLQPRDAEVRALARDPFLRERTVREERRDGTRVRRRPLRSAQVPCAVQALQQGSPSAAAM